MKIQRLVLAVFAIAGMASCEASQATEDQTIKKEIVAPPKKVVTAHYDSLEFEAARKLYTMRNTRSVTHTVWRSDDGRVEGDCPSIGYGIPRNARFTNPLRNIIGKNAVVPNPEPNNIFVDTQGIWVLCIESKGIIAPISVPSKPTVYPWPVQVDYDTNRVTRAGKTTVTIDIGHR